MEELCRHNDAGKVIELFGAGTAAVVCPIGKVGYKHKDILFPTFEKEGGYGVVSQGMLTSLQDIFTGVRKSDWSVRCE